MKTIQTTNAPAAVGPYSQAIEANGFIFCSGQIGLDPVSNQLVEGIDGQTRQVIKNLEEVLKAGNSSLEHIIKTTIYITNIQDFAKVNEIYGSFFTNHKPARVTVEVSNLPKAALIEIDATAAVKS